ncbi:hypothetical protein ABW286_22960 [Erwinia papayae]|uniref:Lipoprotein n=2 Tax=Erwinia TaxID=551 RepID=A0A014LX22_9GAMM|nr:hypothetical protein [Erwinia mallotivora]EXU74136.1 hypothetical protein BG55_18865 [Erwinia mallotivora]
MKYKNPMVMLLLLIFGGCAHSSQLNSITILLDASKLKAAGFTDGETGEVYTDLYGDGSKDSIEYTYSDSTPPGTCAQADCSASLNESPMMTFEIKMHDGKSVDASYMCTSLGVSENKHKGMRDIFCGPNYILKWNGDEYDTGDE